MIEILDTFQGGKDAEIETPKASRERYVEGVSPSPSSRLWGLGDLVRFQLNRMHL